MSSELERRLEGLLTEAPRAGSGSGEEALHRALHALRPVAPAHRGLRTAVLAFAVAVVLLVIAAGSLAAAGALHVSFGAKAKRRPTTQLVLPRGVERRRRDRRRAAHRGHEGASACKGCPPAQSPSHRMRSSSRPASATHWSRLRRMAGERGPIPSAARSSRSRGLPTACGLHTSYTPEPATSCTSSTGTASTTRRSTARCDRCGRHGGRTRSLLRTSVPAGRRLSTTSATHSIKSCRQIRR